MKFIDQNVPVTVYKHLTLESVGRWGTGWEWGGDSASVQSSGVRAER